MERGSSLPHSQELTTCHCPEPVQSNPFSHPTSLLSIVIWSIYVTVFQVISFPRVSTPKPYLHLTTSPYVLQSPSVSCFFSLSSQMIFGEECSLQSSSLCSLLHVPAATYKSRYFGKIWNRRICSYQLRHCFLFWKQTQEQHASKGRKALLSWNKVKCICKFIHSSSLSYDRSKVSSEASSPHSAIQSFLLQMRVFSPFLKVIQ